MRDDYVHVLLFFLEIVDIPIIGKLQSKIKRGNHWYSRRNKKRFI